MDTTDSAAVMNQVRALMDENRARCLWFLREDYYPETTEEAVQVLQAIERHADVETFKKAATLRKWLLQNTKETSAA